MPEFNCRQTRPPNPYVRITSLSSATNSAQNQTTNDVFAWDHMFGKTGTMINQLRLGYSRFATWQYVNDYGIAANSAAEFRMAISPPGRIPAA